MQNRCSDATAAYVRSIATFTKVGDDCAKFYQLVWTVIAINLIPGAFMSTLRAASSLSSPNGLDKLSFVRNITKRLQFRHEPLLCTAAHARMLCCAVLLVIVATIKPSIARNACTAFFAVVAVLDILMAHAFYAMAATGAVDDSGGAVVEGSDEDWYKVRLVSWRPGMIGSLPSSPLLLHITMRCKAVAIV